MPFRALTAAVVLATAMVAVLPQGAADHAFTQPVFFTWDTTEIDILVLGVDDPTIGQGIRDAVQAWRDGVAALGGPQIKAALELRLYIAGLDAVPPEGYEPLDVEVFVVTPGSFAVNACLIIDLCKGEPVCSAHAPVFPGDAFRVAAHEIGHCLGLDHVFNHRYEYQPFHDVMGLGMVGHGGYACPSNLNVMTLERVFGEHLGLPSGGQGRVAASSYGQAACVSTTGRS